MTLILYILIALNPMPGINCFYIENINGSLLD